ncbi:hypothetical protein CR513_46122, partial [Mucuna pruriens]
MSMQFMWKACLHFGKSLRISVSSNCDRQTVHSRPCLDPIREENLKNGSASITCLSIPESLDLDRFPAGNLIYLLVYVMYAFHN